MMHAYAGPSETMAWRTGCMHAVSSIECRLISKHVTASIMICLLPHQAIVNLAEQIETLLAVDRKMDTLSSIG